MMEPFELEKQPEVIESAENTQPATERKFPIWIIALLAVIVLSGAAYLGARLVNARPTAGEPQMFMGKPGMGARQASFSLDMEPAPELPTRQADKRGMVTEVKDKSLMVGDGGQLTVSIDEGGSVTTNTDQTGPTTEVVVTGNTQIYRDTTFDERMPENGEKIQQVVEPIELSQIAKNSFVSVWGYERGDRLIAEVILYSQPVTFSKGE